MSDLKNGFMPPFDHGPIGPLPEYLLLDLVDRLGRAHDSRLVVHIHLSMLEMRERRDYHQRIAASTFQHTVGSGDGTLFPMSNQDLLFIFREEQLPVVEEAVARVCRLFRDDPLGS